MAEVISNTYCKNRHILFINRILVNIYIIALKH